MNFLRRESYGGDERMEKIILGRAEHAVKMIRGGDKCMEGVLLGSE